MNFDRKPEEQWQTLWPQLGTREHTSSKAADKRTFTNDLAYDVMRLEKTGRLVTMHEEDSTCKNKNPGAQVRAAR